MKEYMDSPSSIGRHGLYHHKAYNLTMLLVSNILLYSLYALKQVIKPLSNAKILGSIFKFFQIEMTAGKAKP